MMQKFAIPKMRITMYSWPLMGVTSIARDHSVAPHFFLGAAFASVVTSNPANDGHPKTGQRI
jgi:hypothetical protein